MFNFMNLVFLPLGAGMNWVLIFCLLFGLNESSVSNKPDISSKQVHISAFSKHQKTSKLPFIALWTLFAAGLCFRQKKQMTFSCLKFFHFQLLNVF